jgi:3-deoxy-D-manno-octulosonic-acid transferase
VYLVYSFLLTVGFLLLLPRFAIDAFRSRKYITGLSQRLGAIPKLDSSSAPLIWLHCVSVGETEAARPLVRALQDRLPAHRLVVSTTTVTGQAVARQAFGKDAAAIIYFPDRLGMDHSPRPQRVEPSRGFDHGDRVVA